MKEVLIPVVMAVASIVTHAIVTKRASEDLIEGVNSHLEFKYNDLKPDSKRGLQDLGTQKGTFNTEL